MQQYHHLSALALAWQENEHCTTLFETCPLPVPFELCMPCLIALQHFVVFGRVTMASTASLWALIVCGVSWSWKWYLSTWRNLWQLNFRKRCCSTSFYQALLQRYRYGSRRLGSRHSAGKAQILNQCEAALSWVLHVLRSKASLGRSKVLRVVRFVWKTWDGQFQLHSRHLSSLVHVLCGTDTPPGTCLFQLMLIWFKRGVACHWKKWSGKYTSYYTNGYGP